MNTLEPTTTLPDTAVEPAVAIEHLQVRIPVDGSPAPVIHDVTLTIGRGEAVGLVGESGSGKSMTARALMRMLPDGAEVHGAIRFEGEDVQEMSPRRLRAYRASSIAMIYQNPHAHINPLRTVGDFLVEGLCQVQKVPRREAEQKVVALLVAVGIADGARRLSQYPHELSGGLLQRVMIAAALATEPDVILADEPTTALDVTTQEEVIAILREAQVQRGLSILLITHDLDLAGAACDRLAVMYAGQVVEVADGAGLVERPLHPYSAGLLAARPEIGVRARLRTVPGRPASGFEVGDGCVFAERCAFVTEQCVSERPQLRSLEGRQVACHRAEELDGVLLPLADGPVGADAPGQDKEPS
ncbi:ABC transporter ATP-binding protein [Mumia zhuanghuii]|uniref:ABC transporter ATP-binding protein n=2 Tax=Mumia TaxID=1546255 RepID=A0ABW1QJA7_9ACTN|nr:MULTISPECIES: ABC transporter ATP-binding protein [Mumia]KAA1418218.1 ABC transporter ATP-binding protein [Mumia zhuanghuii]